MVSCHSISASISIALGESPTAAGKESVVVTHDLSEILVSIVRDTLEGDDDEM